MKIVVTGALGYLGSAFIRILPRAFPKTQIILLDNLSTGQLHALNGLPQRTRAVFIEADIRSFDFSKLRLNRKDKVIHLAGLSRPADSYETPKAFESVNIDGAVKIASVCAKTGAAFFFPSTTSVYHQISGKTILDCSSHLKPQTPYAATKLKAEQALNKIKRLRYTVIRFGTIFGTAPVFSIQTAVNKFCWQAKTGQPITVWETALHQLRPYLAIEDATALILYLIQKNLFERKTYHAATCHASVGNVVHLIKRNIPSAKIDLKKAKAMNALSYKIDRKQILNLDFKFRGNLKKSIGEILKSLPDFSKQSFRQA